MEISDAIELRHLRYFVAVAEELHFGRAARRLGIAQPPLSQQIQRLEARLGVVLLRRSRRQVELTEAGRTLLDGARDLIHRAQLLVETVVAGEAGVSGTVRMGYVGSAVHEVLPTLIRAFRERYPQAVVALQEYATTEQLAAIREGTLDAGLVRLPVDAADVATVRLVEEPLVIVLPDFHPLAGRRRLPLAALANEPFVLWGRALNPLFHDEVIEACGAAGFRPRIVQEAGEMPTIVSLVAAGLGVSLVPESMERVRTEGVSYIPVQGRAVRIALALAWRREHPPALVRNLVEVARETLPARRARPTPGAA
jgi:DNA-binding transcriptional LysR family regulator